MPTTSGPELLPIPQATDSPDGPGAFLALLQAMQTGGAWVYGTLAALNAVTGKYPNQLATVNADTAANNGYYLWNGTTNKWVQLPFLTAGNAVLAPSSVSGTGVTIANVGTISFSASNAVGVNGVFTTAYDNYFLVIDITSASAADDLVLRLSASGAAQTGALYSSTRSSVTPGTTAYTVATTTGQTYTLVGRIDAGGSSVKAEVFAPRLAHPTRLMATGYDASRYTTQHSGALADTTAYDGFVLFPLAGGTMTGTLRVYGYNNG